MRRWVPVLLLSALPALFACASDADITNRLAGEYNVPAPFIQIIADRALIDVYQQERFANADPGPAPRTEFLTRNRDPRFVRVVESRLDPAALQYRAGLPAKFVPLRGYRAPILERAGETPPATAQTNHWTEREREAAAWVARRLAHDGLLPTLARVLSALGPARFLTNDSAAPDQLWAVGLPADLLACFPPDEERSGTSSESNIAPAPGHESALRAASLWVLRDVARRLTNGTTPAELAEELRSRPFRHPRASAEFHVATEGGEHEIGLLRVQAGGGYRSGVVPGASIDVIHQLVEKVPSADLLVSVPRVFLQPFHQFAARAWRLRRPGHLTLVAEPLPVAAWAQDNGKAGFLAGGAGAPPRVGTLTPRYACIDEGQSSFEAGESFLMDGLRSAGHPVAQSFLLFQGGNLMAVREPKTGRRVLLIGEGEIHRNRSLGLTREQVMEAFRLEFGVDRCVEMPGASYHLDFDVCLRARDGDVLAFVNDNLAAARLVLGVGLAALQRHGLFETNAAGPRWEAGGVDDVNLVGRLRTFLGRQRSESGEWPATFLRCFAADRSDSAVGNAQCFLLALDLVESATTGAAPSDDRRAAHLEALRRLMAASQKQTEVLRAQGWKIVPIPSMADLYRGINYLNGIQHRDGYLMPAFGGFYTAVDQAAESAFRQHLGPGLQVVRIQSAECQRQHGGLHCVAAAYPRPTVSPAAAGAATDR